MEGKIETELEKLTRLWWSDIRTEEIAMEMGCKRSKLHWMAKRAGLPRRTHVRRDVAPGSYVPDPTEEEIWGPLTAAIRAKWTPAEERSRRAEGHRVRWSVPSLRP